MIFFKNRNKLTNHLTFWFSCRIYIIEVKFYLKKIYFYSKIGQKWSFLLKTDKFFKLFNIHKTRN